MDRNLQHTRQVAIPIRRELLSLVLHPFVQAPPFMNDDYRSMAPLIARQGEKPSNLLGGVSECYHPRFQPSWLTRSGR
jgi:hypothetical protein